MLLLPPTTPLAERRMKMGAELIFNIFEELKSGKVEDLLDARDAIQNIIDTGDGRGKVLLAAIEHLAKLIEKIQESEVLKEAMKKNNTPIPHNTLMPSNTPLPGNAQESDPHGTDPHAPGAKLDDGKPLAGMTIGDFSRALSGVIDVGTFGAKKYSRSGWLEVPDAEFRYKNALYRHLLDSEASELDKDSGLPVLAHATWNLLAWLELVLRRKAQDPSDRELINEDAGC